MSNTSPQNALDQIEGLLDKFSFAATFLKRLTPKDITDDMLLNLGTMAGVPVDKHQTFVSKARELLVSESGKKGNIGTIINDPAFRPTARKLLSELFVQQTGREFVSCPECGQYFEINLTQEETQS